MVITTTPLRERMRRALCIRNVSPRTESIYIHMVAGFAAHFRRSSDRLGHSHIEQYLFFIRDVKKVSYCWYN
ncbi:MAG: phage integrase N-terminal SAM-like domain-containing protein [Acidobacteriota bacterium]